VATTHSNGKKEYTPAKAKESTPPANVNTEDIEIDAGNTLPGPIQLFILQYLPEILDKKKIFKHSNVKATNKPRIGMRYLKVICKDLDLRVTGAKELLMKRLVVHYFRNPEVFEKDFQGLYDEWIDKWNKDKNLAASLKADDARDVVFLVGAGRSRGDEALEFFNREFERDVPQLDGMRIVRNDNASTTKAKRAASRGFPKRGPDDDKGADHRDDIFLEAMLNASPSKEREAYYGQKTKKLRHENANGQI
jgi:hypothetical protein